MNKYYTYPHITIYNILVLDDKCKLVDESRSKSSRKKCKPAGSWKKNMVLHECVTTLTRTEMMGIGTWGTCPRWWPILSVW